MAKINKLPKHMADLIAAGEVVERPASVVKEILENAVDAGASSVTVEINNGGISYIRVTDDGCGIERGDVKTAFLSHATSKISSAEDLNSIMTLGFRGEALPSIAAVSKVNMITKTENEQMGTSISIEGGQVTDISDAGCARGTTIIVRNLFYNTPARMKFLKKDVSEGNFVAGAVEKLALSHPEISFRFIRDGKQVFTTNGDGELRNVCFGAFGKNFSDGLLSVNGKVGAVSVSGVVTPPFKCRGSRGMQYFFVNGRSVKNATVTAAFENAYKNSVMVGKFPGGVLFINLPPQLVDVNVHPSKIEVRFSDERAVFDAVYHSVKSALSENTSIKHAVLPEKRTAIEFAKPTPEYRQTTVEENIAFTEKVLKPLHNIDLSVSDVSNEYSADADDDIIKIEFPVKSTPTVQSKEPQIEEAKPAAPVSADFRLIGEVYKTYILIEYDGTLCVIDKHAAHERIIFNKLKKESKTSGKQMLLSPVTVTLDKNEYTAVTENLDTIAESGFDVEDFGGGSVIVRSCPIDLDSCDIPSLIGEIAGYLIKNRRDITTEQLDWIYHNVACRSAIKAGDKNAPEELYELAKQVLFDNDVRFCPHGRPVMIEISKRELEKQFGRV
ncbi:MAG: DNA mismatch repair endonuclease MutL [Oscillospiraceae bacterium]|nr:DNA mismatch repair endonuclease MutL [Oscillospiraceae bacterium]